MTTSPVSPAAQLPPHIVPTLPPDMTTTPSGLVVPSTPGGLIVVRNELSPVTTGTKLVVPTKPISGDGALDAAKQAYAELATSQGEAAASIVLGGQVELATRVRNDEIRAQAIQAFLAGDVETAAALLARTR